MNCLGIAMSHFGIKMRRRTSRSGQTVVEAMLLVSVFVIAIVALVWPFFGGEDGMAAQLEAFGEGAKTVYYCDPVTDGNCTR